MPSPESPGVALGRKMSTAVAWIVGIPAVVLLAAVVFWAFH
jgi:hypothetical protein